jgi:hypothetical protein
MVLFPNLCCAPANSVLHGLSMHETKKLCAAWRLWQLRIRGILGKPPEGRRAPSFEGYILGLAAAARLRTSERSRIFSVPEPSMA